MFKKKQRQHGDRRRRVRFAWLPTKIADRWEWLVHYIQKDRWTEVLEVGTGNVRKSIRYQWETLDPLRLVRPRAS